MGAICPSIEELVPHSSDAERCLIASMMLDAGVIPAITQVIAKESFYEPDHQIIFDVVTQLFRQRRPVDAVILRHELEKRKLLDDVGGVAYIAQILNAVPSSAHAMEYAREVADEAKLRGLLRVADSIRSRVNAATRSPDRAQELAQEVLADVSAITTANRRAEFVTIGSAVADVYEQLDRGGLPTVRTGIQPFDELTGGIGIGEMCVVAARPSMGKSTLIRQIAAQAAAAGVPTALVSLEENRFKIGRNLLASHGTIENTAVRRANLNDSQWEQLAEGVAYFSELPLFILDRSRRLADISAAISVLKAQHGVQLVIIDYIQRIQGAPGRDRYEQVSYISTAVSDLFKENEVAGIAVAQLNRAVESRQDRRPLMSDLRDSGQLEQDADGVVFLHREDYYHLDDGNYTPTGDAELILAKWRDGVRGKVIHLQSDLKHQRFRERVVEDPFT